MSKYYLTIEKEKSKNSSIESQMDYFFTSDNVTSKINHENSDAAVPSEENHDDDIIDISGKDPSDVNITTQKDENPSVSPVEPSEPSFSPDRSQLTANTPIENFSMPILSVEDFFSSNQSLPLVAHSLEQSPCYSIIGSKPQGKHIMYYCRIHTEFKNINLESIEHHCRLSDPDQHRAEIMKSFRDS
jgi:hypothetical protein